MYRRPPDAHEDWAVRCTQKCQTCGTLLTSTAQRCGFCGSDQLRALKETEVIPVSEYLKP